MSFRHSKRFAWPAAFLAAAFVGVQFVRPELTNPPVAADLVATPEVKEMLKVSCYDCHSDETRLRWFDQIVPAYWMVARDVKQGRQHLNFSELGGLPAAQQTATLFESFNQSQLGVMPPKSYLLMHPEARLSPSQLTVLENHLRSLLPATAPNPGSVAAADRQYQESTSPNASPAKVSPAPNGLAFPQDYKNWKAISSTERFDNGTMRVILGNEVAMRAIAANQINPWPDGTTFAKVAWEQLADDHGIVRAGAFKQVEFMVKDRKKYASTAGWGWGRWLGTDLQPFGKAANFTSSCVSCHTPMRDNDFVFTMPIKGQP